ncbi:hypothetical protein IOE58_07600 [Brachybacterium sp. Marseille-Q2903]|uniref:Uncharacterized protein n=1 Tax=Brachybacterium epidermidis TaxID=2781983 RepID=A0ABR9W0T0_9MICO|nr:hypothetical protein [Brachybacterium epidermidis]MBE9404059.1 hypothetical protein [Brachybacterium epidermidis]
MNGDQQPARGRRLSDRGRRLSDREIAARAEELAQPQRSAYRIETGLIGDEDVSVITSCAREYVPLHGG